MGQAFRTDRSALHNSLPASRFFEEQQNANTKKFQARREDTTLSELQFSYKIVDRKRKPGLKAKATITKVQLVKAAEIFREKAKDPEQQLFAVHGRVNDREMRIATFPKPQGAEISSKSRLAQFKQHYKNWPRVGMRVDVVTDQNGYWKIAL